MSTSVIPFIIIGICIIVLIVMFINSRKTGKRKEKQGKMSESSKTAQEFVNVTDIRDIFLYTKDKLLISYVKVQPISLDLLSENEKKLLAKQLTAELSSEDNPFKFLAVSRPVDITPLVNEYMDLIAKSSDLIQKELLRQEIQLITNYSLSGEVVERQFYYMLWEKISDGAENDLRKRTTDFANKLRNAGVKSTILKENEIIRLCNLVNNPAYISVENIDAEPAIPVLAD